MKITFHSYVNKTNFHLKTFALSLAFIVRFTGTRKWPIVPRPGPKKLFKCPGVVAQKCFIFVVSRLISIKSKIIQAKCCPSWVLFLVVSVKIGTSCSSSFPFMSYLDVFNKKMTEFTPVN